MYKQNKMCSIVRAGSWPFQSVLLVAFCVSREEDTEDAFIHNGSLVLNNGAVQYKHRMSICITAGVIAHAGITPSSERHAQSYLLQTELNRGSHVGLGRLMSFSSAQDSVRFPVFIVLNQPIAGQGEKPAW